MCNIKPNKTDYYLPQDQFFNDVIIDQSFLVRAQDLKNIDFAKVNDKEQPSRTNEHWYPGANSYYNHVEDIDPFNKVNYLLATPEIVDKCLQKKGPSTHTYDAYTEREAQVRYLESIPVSFIIMGKPDIGQKELGKRLAEYWKCVYIDPQTLIEEEVESKSCAGECIEFNLRNGRSIGIDIILNLLKKRVGSDICLHRGFVICGLPVIPNDLYEEEPISTESAIFTAKDIFQSICKTVTNICCLPSDTHILDANSKDNVSQAKHKENEKIEETFSENYLKIGRDYEKQLDFLFDLLNGPFFIINVYCGSIDVVNRRDSNRFYLQTRETINLQKQHYNKLYRNMFLSGNNSEFEQDFIDMDSFEVDLFRLKDLVKIPCDFNASVSAQLDYYHYTALQFIKSRVLAHSAEYFIKVDGRTTVTRMLNIIKSRLNIMNVQKVLIPNKLSDTELEAFYTTQETLLGPEDEEEQKEQNEEKRLTPKEYFEQLRKVQAPSNKYMWSWSDWESLCPVSMRSGYIREGNVKYAVQFMNKIFFLFDNESYLKFYSNPRPFLLPPFPKTSCKIVIFGPRLSGRSALAQCLAYYFDGTVLSTVKIMKAYLDERQDEYLSKIKKLATAEAIALLNEQRKIEAEEREKERIDQIREWLKTTIGYLEEMVNIFDEIAKEEKVEHFEISSFPMQMKRITTQDMLEDTEFATALAKIREELFNLGVPIYKMDEQTWRSLLTERKKLLQYLPLELAHKQAVKPATAKDDFVKEYVNDSLARAGLGNIQLNAGGLLETFMRHFRIAEEKYKSKDLGNGGWIIDGMMCNLEVIDGFFPLYIGDEVIVLTDPDGQFLEKRFADGISTYFREYKQFFEDIGLPDAAHRSPSISSTKSTEESFIRDVLDNLLDSGSFYFNPETNKPDPSQRLEEYKNDLLGFQNDWEKIKEFYLQHNITPREINVANKSFPQLFREVIKNIQDKYRARAHPRKIVEKSNVPNDLEEKGSDLETEDTTIVGTKPEENRENIWTYGDTWHYCPVTLHENWVLWKGKRQFALTYNDHDYLLATEKDYKKFLKDPWEFLPFSVKKCPPPRICIVGVTGCGKTTLAKEISNNYGLIYVSYEHFLKTCFNVRANQTLNELATDRNSVLYNYLQGNVPLPENAVEKLAKYWLGEPYKSKGFVLDDFPRTPRDIEFMVRKKLIPDMIIYPSSTESYLKTKFIDRALKSWQESMDKHRQEIELRHSKALEKWREDRAISFNILIEEKREKRYSERIQDKQVDAEQSETNSQISYDSVAEQKDLEEVNKVLDEEFPPLKFDVPTENPEAFVSKTKPLIFNTVQKDIELIKKIKEKALLEEIPFSEISLNLDNFNKTIIASYLLLEPIKFRNDSYLEHCYEVSLELADRLLSSGYFFLSKFGKTCPVQYYNNIDPLQMYSLAEERNTLYPVVYRNYIYYLIDQNKEQFMNNVLKYINKEFKFPLIPFKIAVTGPPKCGKTLLAKRFQDRYGFSLITRGNAVRYVLKYLPECDLGRNMETVLRKGWELTDEMVIKSVQAASFDKKAASHGIVFDGFPNSLNEVKHLAFLDLLPNIVIDLKASSEQVLECLSQDIPKSPFPKYSKCFVLRFYELWSKDSGCFREWFDREYQATVSLPIDPSKWRLYHESKGYLESTFWEIKHYHQHISEDWPLRLGNMLVTPLEFLDRQTSYRHYCPLCLHFSNKLVSGGDPPDRTGLIQFRFNFYWICNDHVDFFLATPELYLPPYNNNNMPASLPKVVACHGTMPDNVYENGSCTVCYKTQVIITKGKLKFAVLYNDKIYLFDKKECLNTFLKNPQQFMFGIEFRAPVYSDLNYKELPILGMLEQYIAKEVIEAVCFISKRRPIIPGLDVKCSALIGLGLFMKSKNDKLDPNLKKYYDDGFELFNERRKKLLRYLDWMTTYRNPYLHYEDILPGFRLPPSVKSESLTTMVSKIVEKCVDNIDLYLHEGSGDE
ncbi:adenylate kinase 9-like [Sitophilus oryzae]|uniref:Adenylate kinase 9-like n=1 Tax=Sitophilus oryzae TaxID=7048 RepID=A0A6J2YUK9_SITOR|nr:adenylate kinase 9-like [Sitophilus oryzae]